MIVDGFLTLYHPKLRSLMDASFFFNLPEAEQITRRKTRQPWVEEGYLTEVMLPNARTQVMPSAAHATHLINALESPEVIYETILDHLQHLSIHLVSLEKALIKT